MYENRWPAWLTQTSQWLRRRIDQVEPPDSLVLVVMSVFVGTGTGLGAVAFIWLLEQIGHFSTWTQTQIGVGPATFLLMGAAGLAVGFIVDRWAREAKGHGVPEVMEAIALRSGRIRPRVAGLKVLASSLTFSAPGFTTTSSSCPGRPKRRWPIITSSA